MGGLTCPGSPGMSGSHLVLPQLPWQPWLVVRVCVWGHSLPPNHRLGAPGEGLRVESSCAGHI